MNYTTQDLDRLARNITKSVEDPLLKSGCFYRIFFRSKQSASALKKLETLNENGSLKYDGKSKFLRDIIGIRINLYFVDDLELMTVYFKKLFKDLYVEETIDANKTTEFKPARVNLIFKIPENLRLEFQEVIKDNRIDPTFELQLRTVFSEGWHEVEHDLRYKCPSDWDEYQDLSRNFNGILAALQTHEWSMIQMFERLSFLHYKSKSISAMVRTKLRIRFTDLSISANLAEKISETILREFYKIDRSRIINIIVNNEIFFPLSVDNVIYLINYFMIKDSEILKNTPELLATDFQTFNTDFL
jgi:putative GTP pyrophosphokinase